MLQVDLVTILTYTIYRQIIGISHGIEKGVAATTPFCAVRCLLLVQPLTDQMANRPCYDRSNYRNNNLHGMSPPSLGRRWAT